MSCVYHMWLALAKSVLWQLLTFSENVTVYGKTRPKSPGKIRRKRGKVPKKTFFSKDAPLIHFIHPKGQKYVQKCLKIAPNVIKFNLMVSVLFQLQHQSCGTSCLWDWWLALTSSPSSLSWRCIFSGEDWAMWSALSESCIWIKRYINFIIIIIIISVPI
jgi:hypothetical protein